MKTKEIKEQLQISFAMDEKELDNNLNNNISDYIDSLEKIEIAIELERHLFIVIPDSIIDKWITINDIITTVNELC